MAVTDNKLTEKYYGPSFWIYCPDSILNKMDDFHRKTYKDTNTINMSKDSETTLAWGEAQILYFLKTHLKGKNILLDKKSYSFAGEDIKSQFAFLSKDMPLLHKFLKGCKTYDLTEIRETMLKQAPLLKNIF